MADWTETYRPRTLAEVRGNDKARDAFREWAETWDEHREAVVLHGSPGVGKTSSAYALANDMGWETVELNASDQRTGDVIERFAGRAARNATLSGSVGGDPGDAARGRQLVILDEADNIHGNYDRGGSSAVTRLVKEASQPIVLIANDYYDMSRGLRNATREIEYRDVSARSIVPVLRDVCRKEGIEYDADALQRIADANDGDLRGAVKDLQAVAEGRERLRVEDVVTGARDRTLGVFDFLDDTLKEESAQEALSSAYDADETPDDLVGWVEENVAKVYEGPELARAYEHLANADRWLGRVRATQEYGYWRYATDNLAAGVAAARDGTKGGWTRYSRPQFYASSNQTADEVTRRVAESAGVSMATARREVLPFLSAMTAYCKPRELTVTMAAYYDFDESHVAHVTGSGESTNKVEGIVAEARERREATMAEHSGSAFAPGSRTGEDAGDGDGEGEGDGDADDGTGGGTDDEAADGQATLAPSEGAGTGAATDDEGGDEDGDEAVEEEDDGQTGLGDFA